MSEASELAKLLSQYEIEGVLWAHDTVAQDVLPQDESSAEVTVTLPANDSWMYNTDQHPPNITIINIEKTNEPLVSYYFNFRHSNLSCQTMRWLQNEKGDAKIFKNNNE